MKAIGVRASRCIRMEGFMKTKRGWSIWVCMLCVFAGTALAADWFVETNGNDSADGTTWATAKLTIQAAVNAAQDGETVLVNTGVYYIAQQIVVTNGITVRSIGDAADCVVDGQNTTRCFYLAHSNAYLSDLTIRNGYINNNNPVGYHGGGVAISSGMVDRCIFLGNRVYNGHGMGGTAVGGAIGFGRVRNSLFIGNRTLVSAGGVALGGALYGTLAENCTIISNKADSLGGLTGGGGGAAECMLINCVVYNNAANAGPGDWLRCTGQYSYCATLLPGTGNSTNAPIFASTIDFDVLPSSPTRNAGLSQDWMTNGADLRGAPRIIGEQPDVGCYEQSYDGTLQAPSLIQPVSLASGQSVLVYTNPAPIWIEGEKPSNCWVVAKVGRDPYGTNGILQTFSGASFSNQIPADMITSEGFLNVDFRCADNTLFLVSSNRTRLQLTSAGYGPPSLAISAPPNPLGPPDTPYVFSGTSSLNVVGSICVSNSANGQFVLAAATPLGGNWTVPPLGLEFGTNRIVAWGTNLLGTTATDEVDAVRILLPTIYVCADSINPEYPYGTLEMAAKNIQEALDVTAHFGASEVLVGPGIYTNGLTISNQIHLSSSEGPRSTTILGNGGRCITITHPNAVVSGFTITGGRNQDGAGVNMPIGGGLVENCIITNNGNRVTSSGVASANGGGILGGSARNCLIVSNFVYAFAGGKQDGYAFGAGAASTFLENCTMVGNRADAYGYYSWGAGGGQNCTFVNSIVWSNPFVQWELAGGSSFDHCYTNDPSFADGACHLSSGSPCINAGTNLDWMVGATDLDGALRILGETVDIGCFEYYPFYAILPPMLTAPIAVAPGSNGLLRTTNDLIWVQGTKPTNTWVAVSSNSPTLYSTNGIFQESAGTTWSNLLQRNWAFPSEIATWRFRCEPLAEHTLNSPATQLRGTAAGLCGEPEIWISSSVTTTRQAQCSLSGNRNLQTLEHMWVSNQANGAVAVFDAPILPATNWTSAPLLLALGTNVLRVYGTNLLGDVAMAQHEVFLECHVGSAGMGSNGAVRVEWTLSTDPAITNQWQRSTNLLSGAWTNLGAPFVATQDVECLIESNFDGDPAFFRMLRTGD